MTKIWEQRNNILLKIASDLDLLRLGEAGGTEADVEGRLQIHVLQDVRMARGCDDHKLVRLDWRHPGQEDQESLESGVAEARADRNIFCAKRKIIKKIMNNVKIISAPAW